MTDREIEGRLARALGAAAPDRLDDALAARREQRAGETVVPLAPPQVRKKRRAIWRGCAAAAMLLFTLGLSWYGYAYTADSVVDIDVNPSVQLTVSRAETVVSYSALNEDGADILGEMDLRGAKLDVAVNALIGSMLWQGYIDELRNSVLITVENSNAEKAQRLQAELAANIAGAFAGYDLEAAVLGQSFSDPYPGLSALAKEYGISEGKASLIQRITEADPALVFADLVPLSVNDLNLLLSAKQADATGIDVTGQASDKAYIGMERAMELALADYPGAELKELELDYDDHCMVYECELSWQGQEVELKLDARTGEILKRKCEGGGMMGNGMMGGGHGNGHHAGRQDASPAPTPSDAPVAGTAPAPSASPYLTEGQVKELVLARIPGAVFTKLKFEVDDGQAVYEGEAELDGLEYEFEIDALTGVILDWDAEEIDD